MHRPDKTQLAQTLEEMGTLLEIRGDNPFKVQAYYRAARIVAGLDGDLREWVDSGRLRSLPGIGATLFEKIREWVHTGRLEAYERLCQEIPPSLLDLVRVPGLGSRKVRTLYEHLGITTLGELAYACQENRLAGLPGFGKKTQERIQAGLQYLERTRGQHLFAQVWPEALALLEQVQTLPGVLRAELAGSLRRRKEVIRDLDLVVAATSQGSVLQAFRGLPQVEAVLLQGEVRTRVRFTSGLEADLLVVPEASFAPALLHATGSADHNAQLRARARTRGLHLNEYGLFQGDHPIPCATEAEVYAALGLPEIPPELREGRGEIEAAEAGQLPDLIQREALRGIFHVHTTYSDGSASLEAMVARAREMGFAYIGISDHSQSAHYARGLSVDRIRAQHREIEALQQRYPEIRIFKGIESDILPDGSLDYPDEVLASFDFVIASVHSHLRMSREEMTRRVLRALSHPATTMLGHPTGRLLLSREEMGLDLETVLQAAARYGVVVELNANPYRLDLDWRWCQRARTLGVRVSINPDAHHLEGLEEVSYGIGIARKGWLESHQVFNTWDPESIQSWFQRRKDRTRRPSFPP